MYRLIVLGSLYVQIDALWVFIDSLFRLVTTSTNSPLQFGWFRLKTEESSVLFESKLENECMKTLVMESKKSEFTLN